MKEMDYPERFSMVIVVGSSFVLNATDSYTGYGGNMRKMELRRTPDGIYWIYCEPWPDNGDRPSFINLRHVQDWAPARDCL